MNINCPHLSDGTVKRVGGVANRGSAIGEHFLLGTATKFREEWNKDHGS